MVPPTEESKKWQASKHIRKRAKYLLENPDAMPVDVTFRVGTHDTNMEDISAHTFVLALGSPEFHRIFVQDLPLRGDNASFIHGLIIINDILPEVFRIFLRYLYSEEIVGLSMDNVMEMVHCAKKYHVARLLKASRDFMQDNLNSDFACAILTKSNLYDEETVGVLAGCLISSQTAKVVASPGFLNLPENVLSVVLARNDLSIGENDVYQAARRWVLHNFPLQSEFEESFARLIECIRLPIMTPSQIANGPAKDRVLGGAELSQVYNFIFADEKPEIRFSAQSRSPRPRSQYVTMKMTEEDSEKVIQAEDTITLEVRCDVAPVASGLFLEMCANDRVFNITYGDADFTRRLPSMKANQNKAKKRPTIVSESNGNGHGPQTEKTIPIENRLLANIPGMVSFIIDPEDTTKEEACIEMIQISHPEKKANQHGLNGMVFAKVVRGMEALKVFALGVEDWRTTRRTHSFTNVVVHSEFNEEEIEEEL